MFRSSKMTAQHTRLDPQCRYVVAPVTDVIAGQDKYLVRCCMPGLEIEDIALNVRGKSISLQAISKLDMPPGLKVHVVEFGSTCYSMKLELPDDCDTSQINAHYEDGFLTLTLPRKSQILGRRVEIKEK